MKLTRAGDVHILTMPEGSQVLNATTIAAFNAALDEVEGSEGPGALVLTGEGKSFNQGLDLPFLGGLGEGVLPFLKSVHALFGRLYRLELPTVAAINGHAIAGGAMLAQCADLRVMRADRGWFRLPEVELRLPFTVVMDALLAARLPQPAAHRLMVLGARLGGAEAAAQGVVDEAADGEAAVLERAMAHAADAAQHRGPVLAQIRAKRYRSLLAEIAADADRIDLMAH